MSAFEFVFSLFGLLLGFSLVEVLGGLARTVEARLRLGQSYKVGWLTPLLALFVVQVGYFLTLPALASLISSKRAMASVLAFALLLAAATFVRSRPANVALLSLLILRYLVLAF